MDSNSGKLENIQPLNLLTQIANISETANLQVLSNTVTWSIYLKQKQITYATHSVDPFDRLERHLRRLSHENPRLNQTTRAEMRLLFDTDTTTAPPEHPEYKAILWLVYQDYLTTIQAAALIEALVQEVIESFLLINTGTYHIANLLTPQPEFCHLDIQNLTQKCQQQLQLWHSLAPQISSPYQRPYFLFSPQTQSQPQPEFTQKLNTWMKGFSIRHLALLINQDELKLAQHLYRYINDGSVLLHEPDPPFDKLPKVYRKLSDTPISLSESLPAAVTLNNIVAEGNNIATQPLAATEAIVITTPDTQTNSIAAPQPIQVVDNAETLASPPLIPVVADNYQANFNAETATSPPLTPAPLTDNSDTEKVSAVVAAATSTSSTEEVELTLPLVRARQTTYTIVCVDDSPAMLAQVGSFLQDDVFSVITINNPLKALMSIIRYKPNLILLDVNMEGIDGYDICRLLRNNSAFKDTPIIMVTGNKGLLDRARARLVGATGYLTKPFTRTELLKIVFRYLM